MRQLTQKEIDNAPEDCNMYYILASGKVGYCFSKSNAAWGRYAPIPHKEFDISEYLESDPEHPSQQPHIFEEDSCLCIDGKVSKFHAIGIAKYFKLI